MKKKDGGIGNENEGKVGKEKEIRGWFRKRKRKGMGRWERRWKGGGGKGRFKDDSTERTPPFLTPNNSWRNPLGLCLKIRHIGIVCVSANH